MSFGRTLLTWAGDAELRARPGNWSGDGEISIFDRNQMPGFNAAGPQSGLFDVNRVNASRRAQGLPADAVAGVWQGNTEQEVSAVSRPISTWSQQARQEESAKSAKEIYFGTDGDLAARAAAQDAHAGGSSDTAALLPQASIAGVVSADQLVAAANKASFQDNALINEVARKMSGGSRSLAGPSSLDRQAQRDLAVTWLASSAADRAQDLVAKRKAALSGYMAIDLSQEDYSGVNIENVYVAGGEKTANFESASQTARAAEKCREIAASVKQIIQPHMEKAEKLVLALQKVPKSCKEDMRKWSADLRMVKVHCSTVNDVFLSMQKTCGASVKLGRCETVRLDDYESSYNEICSGYENLSDKDKAERTRQLAELTRDIDYEVRDSFNISIAGQAPGGNDFFPQTQGVQI